MLRTLFGTSIALIDSTLDDRGLTPLLLNQKPRYAVSVHPMKDFSAFTFNPNSASLCRTISNAFYMVLRSVFSNNQYVIYVRTYHVKPFKYFGYILLEDIRTVADPHMQFMILLLTPRYYNSTYLFGYFLFMKSITNLYQGQGRL